MSASRGAVTTVDRRDHSVDGTTGSRPPPDSCSRSVRSARCSPGLCHGHPVPGSGQYICLHRGTPGRLTQEACGADRRWTDLFHHYTDLPGVDTGGAVGE